MFYFRLMTSFKIKFLQINHPGAPLDPDQYRHSVGLHLGSNGLQKAIDRLQNSPLVCKEL